MPSARNLAHIGLDVGSTTVKVVIFNTEAEAVYARYQRHMSDVRATVAQMLAEALDAARLRRRSGWRRECVRGQRGACPER